MEGSFPLLVFQATALMPQEGAAWGVDVLFQLGEGEMAEAAEMLIVVFCKVQ